MKIIDIEANVKWNNKANVSFIQLEVGAIIWPKNKTFCMEFSPFCVLFPIMLVCFLCVTKQQMLVQVFRVLQKNIC